MIYTYYQPFMSCFHWNFMHIYDCLLIISLFKNKKLLSIQINQKYGQQDILIDIFRVFRAFASLYAYIIFWFKFYQLHMILKSSNILSKIIKTLKLKIITKYPYNIYKCL